MPTISKLFEKEESKRDKKTIVFDLDETLVHVTQIPRVRKVDDPNTYIIPIPEVSGMEHNINRFLEVSIRPGCQDMLEQLSEKFELVLFTASHPEYMKSVLRLLK